MQHTRPTDVHRFHPKKMIVNPEIMFLKYILESTSIEVMHESIDV